MDAETKLLFERLENEKKAFRLDQERFHKELHAVKDEIALLMRLKASHKQRRKHLIEWNKKLMRLSEDIERRLKEVGVRERANDERDRKIAQRQREQDLRDKQQDGRDSDLLRREEAVAIAGRQVLSDRKAFERLNQQNAEQKIGV